MEVDEILMELDPNAVRCFYCHAWIDRSYNLQLHKQMHCSADKRGLINCVLCGWGDGFGVAHIYEQIIRRGISVEQLEKLYFHTYKITINELDPTYPYFQVSGKEKENGC